MLMLAVKYMADSLTSSFQIVSIILAERAKRTVSLKIYPNLDSARLITPI